MAQRDTSTVAPTGVIQIALWKEALKLLNEEQLCSLQGFLTRVIDSGLEGVTGDPETDGIRIEYVQECLEAARKQRALIEDRLHFLHGLN